MGFNFDDRHIVITGGAGVLGSAVVQLLAGSGAPCSVPCFNEAEQETFELSSHENVFTQAGIDLTDEERAQSFYKDAIEYQGPLWGSIHIAGGFGVGNIEDTPLTDFNKQIQLNTVTCYNSCRTAVQAMRSSGYSGGRIVNIAARPALEPRQGKGMTAYTVAKAGVAALTESLAAEVVEDDILVNAIAPSVIDTPQNRDAMPDANFEDWPNPQQLAKQIAHLVSPENEVTRGSVVTVYGKS
ncbi:NAD(P)-dependent dehydrogenase, short-chain alcohol dehydrogenase family [Fodinibius salinus]|uniref:NAD(P)-dependent dehydrogenase, short-chain alcohol dehydrogenase family n=1 Tax=Fodinibius salinus TaxID=860790 RepID=A0A5D3YL79_9BACT|nr:SDR family NAD(P)-dependent oxidoreductase [Fodinibius salinus]TYP93417.1 NAD(P)-dependent dehydrogenase, short-chain alcohol dehydrogenase family [Fodinibius salinus]